MKALLILAFVAYSANAALLGARQCTWGPSYWCSNITAAAGCNAVKHCIQTVWEHKQVEPDNDSVCEICKKMVQEARDQLESNETQEEIKEVFEGSCNLLPIKIVRKECCKLADDFIVELVDTLASQMNPQVVCSVAGLCNSVRIDNLLASAAVKSEGTDSDDAAEVATLQDTCSGCHTVVDIMQQKFQALSKDQFLKFTLQICGRMSSLSDACSNIVLNYFEDIYTHMLNNFNSNNICLMSGECSAQFHVHNVEITPLSKTGVVPNKPSSMNDDLPCDLCMQLVGHLRDLLIANTTEIEFKRVLTGLCKQTKPSFQKQCLAWVDEYYQVVYNYLVTQLDSSAICKDINICPGGSTLLGENAELQPIVPLLPIETIDSYESQKAQESQRGPIDIVQRPELMQLPIERVFLAPLYDKKVCVFCQYFLHYVQQAITEPGTEKEIKDVIDRACNHLPSIVNNTCVEFVNTYGEAVLALLAQDIDPSVVCPLIRLCPSVDLSAGGTVEVFMQNTGNADTSLDDKPKCGLCLFAVTRLEELVKDQKTAGNIKSALHGLCSHFSGEIQLECKDFVDTYTDELVDMMIADFTPQEVCVYLQLCDDKMPPKPLEQIISEHDQRILTNEISDNTINGVSFNKGSSKKAKASPQCVLCEFVMSKLQDDLKNKTTQDEIKHAVHNICHIMPKSVRKECDAFVDKYADAIIVLLESAIEPEEICEMISLCEKKKKIEKPSIQSKGSGPQCFICKYIIQKIDEITPPVDESDFIDSLQELCYLAPNDNKADCHEFIKKAGHEIYNLLKIGTQPAEICGILFFCATDNFEILRSEINVCGLCHATVLSADTALSEGDSTVGNEENIRKGCYTLPGQYVPRCMKIMNHYHNEILAALNRFEDSGVICLDLKLCNGSEFRGRVRRAELLGAKKCTWGPSYWCESSKNAEECGNGAVKHCQSKVWLQEGAP